MGVKQGHLSEEKGGEVLRDAVCIFNCKDWVTKIWVCSLPSVLPCSSAEEHVAQSLSQSEEQSKASFYPPFL